MSPIGGITYLLEKLARESDAKDELYVIDPR